MDDLALEVIGSAKFVVTELAKATDFVTAVLEDDLQLEVSTSKSVTVGSRPVIAQRVASKLRKVQVRSARSAKMLGVGTAGGRRRCASVLRSRIVKVRARVPRIQQLRRAGVNSALLVRTGIIPAMTYGQDISGVSNSMLLQQRRIAAKASAAPGSGKDLNLSLWIEDFSGRRTDPAFAAHIAPIVTWATAVWQRWMPIGVLAGSALRAQQALSRATNLWSAVAGPARATVASMLRIWWKMVNGSRFHDDQGFPLDFTLDSPAAVAVVVQASVRRWRVVPLILPYHLCSWVVLNLSLCR